MNKKGFTLIELLAVIVILAIIALIVTPVISDLIKSAKSAANARSVEGHIKNIEYAIVEKAFEVGNGDISSYDSITDDTTLRNTLTLPDSDHIVCDTLTINNGKVVEATGCKESSWENNYNYSEETGASTGGTTSSSTSSGGTSSTEYVDAILNGTDPVLGNNLIPVTIDNDGTVKKANTKSKWYDYSNKIWANAVILKDNTIEYDNGATIPESNIDAYFVWIPRYKYKLFDMGQYNTYSGTSKPASSIAHTIEVVFESKTTTPSNGNAVGEYLTHPAFTSFNVNGIWVGKFEVSGSTSDLDVKPNVASLKSTSVGDFFTSMYNYNRNLDSHMMKNTEWGAVAYLSLSEYGINDEVRINNSSQYTTGCAATVAATTYVNRSQSNHSEGYYAGCENSYNTSIGYLASTTGNISGVYDVSGGASEYVTGHITRSVGNSGLTLSNYDTKYFDEYSSSSSENSYNYRILGDATGEVGPFYQYDNSDGNTKNHNNWYADRSEFIGASYPWFIRGGDYRDGMMASQLYFNSYTGSASGNTSSRLVLAP